MAESPIRADFIRDGAVCMRRIVDPAAARRLFEEAERLDLDGHHFTAHMDMASQLESYWKCVGPLAPVAAELMGSERVHFYNDHLFIKRAGQSQPSKWHQDGPFWPFKGEHIVAAWIAMTPVRRDGSALQYVRGSHLRGKYYQPGAPAMADASHPDWLALEECPDYFDEKLRAGETFLSWDMEPGDVLWHQPLTVHGAYANDSPDGPVRAGLTVRFLGDDVKWDPRPYLRLPQECPAVAADQRLLDDNGLFPLIWRRGESPGPSGARSTAQMIGARAIMTFLRNFWYCAAWSHELVEAPLGRMLLGEKLVLYRGQNGAIVALGDVCPHRFAPLHKGPVKGDDIACPYHGLRFGPDGRCSLNPHGDIIPPSLRVASYPVVERHDIAWIWMGDEDLADPDLIPNMPGHGVENFRAVSGRIPVKGSFELVADNLLDLSHTQYLHSMLTFDIDDAVRRVSDVHQDGDHIQTIQQTWNAPALPFVKIVWPDAPDRVDHLGGLRWEPPANMLLKVNFVAAGVPEEDGLHAWGAELVTPETETSCHYFWSFSRDYRLDDSELDGVLRRGIEGVFTSEDAWMIGLVQENMGEETDLIGLQPVVLPTDNAAIRARRIMRRLRREQSSGASADLVDVEG